MSELWPWIIPLPAKTDEQYQVLTSIFSSKVATSIVKCIRLYDKTYQKEIIGATGFSKKAVLNVLNRLVKFNILNEGTERVERNGRKYWVKWYTPTFLGKWLILLLTPIEKINREDLHEILSNLFNLYATSLAKLCLKLNMDFNQYYVSLNKAYFNELSKVLMNTKKHCSVAVFGSSALDYIISLDEFPKSDEVRIGREISISPGGSSANVAVALSRLKVPTAFIGKIGSDDIGRIVIKSLINEGIDLSSVIIEDKRTPYAIVVIKNGFDKRIIVPLSDNMCLSISNPSEINWSIVDEVKLIYIGEVFIEAASALSSYARSKDKIVVYRPSTPFLNMGFEKLKPVFENTDILITNMYGWSLICKSSCKKLRYDDFISVGVKYLIITKGGDGVDVATENYVKTFPSIKANIVDTSYAGDVFSAGLIKALLDGSSIDEAINYASRVSAISISRTGGRSKIPFLEELT
ncbi:MAG: carbohydrate kinase family protein [Candidatus Methanomethylicia archaeon]